VLSPNLTHCHLRMLKCVLTQNLLQNSFFASPETSCHNTLPFALTYWALAKQKLSNGYHLSLCRGSWRVQVVPKWHFCPWIITKGIKDTASFILWGEIRQNRQKSRVMIAFDFPLDSLFFLYTMKIAVRIFSKLDNFHICKRISSEFGV